MAEAPVYRHELDPTLELAFRVWLKGAALRSCIRLLELVTAALAERQITLRYELLHHLPPEPSG